MKIKLSLFPGGLVFCLLGMLFIDGGCKRDHENGPAGGGAPVFTCGGNFADTSIIKGPAVGENGNDHDNPFRSLAIDPGNPLVLYVGSEGNGVFRSTDGGNNWQWLRNGIHHCEEYPEIYSIAIDPANPAHLLMATNSGPGVPGWHGDGVYMSNDSGNHWMGIDTGLTSGAANSVAFSPFNPQICLAGIAGGRSTNRNNQGQLFSGGLFSSTNGGGRWQPFYNTAPANINNWWEIKIRVSNNTFSVYSLGASSTTDASSQPSGLFVASGNGTVKRLLFDSIVLGSPFNGSMFDVSADQRYLYVNNDSYGIPLRTIRSTDSGATWVQTAQAGNGPIRIVGNNPNAVVFAIYSDIYRSSDGMNTATLAFSGSSLHLDNDVMDIEVAPSNSNIVYAVAKGLHVYKSSNGGAGFTEVANLRNFINTH
ncbi:MAG: hypothetical protein J0H74_12120 [Chitinophagaceae bacterium]|nr:hypothetical protein [Chitinophagaceae bacterium]